MKVSYDQKAIQRMNKTGSAKTPKKEKVEFAIHFKGVVDVQELLEWYGLENEPEASAGTPAERLIAIMARESTVWELLVSDEISEDYDWTIEIDDGTVPDPKAVKKAKEGLEKTEKELDVK